MRDTGEKAKQQQETQFAPRQRGTVESPRQCQREGDGADQRAVEERRVRVVAGQLARQQLVQRVGDRCAEQQHHRRMQDRGAGSQQHKDSDKAHDRRHPARQRHLHLLCNLVFERRHSGALGALACILKIT